MGSTSVFGIRGGKPGHETISIKGFEKRLSDEMVVPARLLTVTYPFERSSKPQLLFPEGGTTRKR